MFRFPLKPKWDFDTGSQHLRIANIRSQQVIESRTWMLKPPNLPRRLVATSRVPLRVLEANASCLCLAFPHNDPLIECEIDVFNRGRPAASSANAKRYFTASLSLHH